MVEFTYTVWDKQGLHVRPVTRLACEADKYESWITASCGEREAGAKSLMSMLALGVKYGMDVTFHIEGPDEEAAAKGFRSLLDEVLENDRS